MNNLEKQSTLGTIPRMKTNKTQHRKLKRCVKRTNHRTRGVSRPAAGVRHAVHVSYKTPTLLLIVKYGKILADDSFVISTIY